MLQAHPTGTLRAVSATYAVNWEEHPGERCSGKLELRSRSLHLDGLDDGRPRTTAVPYRDISAVRVARSSTDRLRGRPTLVLDRRGRPPIRIAGVAQSGIVSELAERLAAVNLGEERPVSRVIVVIPLVQGVRDRVAALVRSGPPFDPEEVGLERHHVFLTEREAIFVFEGTIPATIRRLAEDTDVWTAASAWAGLVAGPPLVAEDVYDWLRPELPENVVYAPTPGPGDSEGGDLYAPGAP
jgi:hypothetical protein